MGMTDDAEAYYLARDPLEADLDDVYEQPEPEPPRIEGDAQGAPA